MRTLVLLLLLANLTLFGYIKLDSVGGGERARLDRQVQPEKIRVLTAQQVAALGPTKMAALADVCVEWGPLSETDKTRALAMLEPLNIGKLVTQKKTEVIANYWVFIPPAVSKVPRSASVVERRSISGLRSAFNPGQANLPG